MRHARITFAVLTLAAMIVQAAFAQTSNPDRGDPIRVLPDGQPLRIERVEDIPRQLKSAIERRCRSFDEWMAIGSPIEIFRPASGYRPMALVPCGTIVRYHIVFIFERPDGREPSPMHFPVIAHGGGFTASEAVGQMSWDPAAKTLIATGSTDIGGAPIGRNTYQHVGGELNGFALVKVERGTQTLSGGEGWHTIWEAQPWKLP